MSEFTMIDPNFNHLKYLDDIQQSRKVTDGDKLKAEIFRSCAKETESLLVELSKDGKKEIETTRSNIPYHIVIKVTNKN